MTKRLGIMKAVQINLRALANQHPILALDYVRVGEAWFSKGEYDKAIGYYEKALQINLKVWGEQHPNLAGNYNCLGVAWFSKGEYDKAIGYYERGTNQREGFGRPASQLGIRLQEPRCSMVFQRRIRQSDWVLLKKR
jgi:tetratricopeptide (TPR) repeat protein